MSDPVRLLASPDATDLERALLQSWEGERPAASAREKTLAVLGLGGGAAAGALVGAGVSVAPKAITAGWLAMAKWTLISALALSVVGVGVVGIGFAVHRSATDARPPAPLVQTPPVATTVTTSETVTDVTTSAPVTNPPQVHITPRATTTASLAEQIAAMDRARAALESGDARGARKLVQTYESEYPGGAFMQEAEVVRIDALVREGDRDAAERAGKHFLATYPRSPHTARVRALLGYDP